MQMPRQPRTVLPMLRCVAQSWSTGSVRSGSNWCLGVPWRRPTLSVSGGQWKSYSQMGLMVKVSLWVRLWCPIRLQVQLRAAQPMVMPGSLALPATVPASGLWPGKALGVRALSPSRPSSLSRRRGWTASWIPRRLRVSLLSMCLQPRSC